MCRLTHSRCHLGGTIVPISQLAPVETLEYSTAIMLYANILHFVDRCVLAIISLLFIVYIFPDLKKAIGSARTGKRSLFLCEITPPDRPLSVTQHHVTTSSVRRGGHVTH